MSTRIPDSIVEEIRNANDIADVVGEYVQLTKKSRNYFGLCPFHNEKTPSFSVSPDKQIFHCFGCGKGGNVFTFIREIEGLSFQEAVQLLGEKSGHQLPEGISGNDDGNHSNPELQNLYEAHNWLTKLYHHLLRHTKEGKDGYELLKERGLTDETIDEFQLGFAPNSKDFTKKFLENKGFHPQSMVKGGLLSYNENGQYGDRFRGRVIFPIRNHQGKTVAFAGRSVNGNDPKYLNSPETDLFHKGKLLYNFDLARAEIRKRGEVVLFEGQMDVISAYQAGIKNGIATLGTAITDAQAKLIRRYVERVIICYDSDDAGIEASYKAANALKQAGCEVRVATVRDGKDPDEFIHQFGSESFKQQVLDTSATYMGFMIQYLKRGYNLQHEGDRIAYIEKVLDEISKMDKPIERDHYVREVAADHDLSVDVLEKEIIDRRKKQGLYKDKNPTKSYTNYQEPTNKGSKLLPAFHNAERQLIHYMMQDMSVAEKVQEQLGGAFNLTEHQVIVTYLYAFYEEGFAPNSSQFIEHVPDPDVKNLVSEIAMMKLQPEISDPEIQDYIRVIQAKKNEQENITSLQAKQKEAERQQDPVRAAQIAMQILELKKSLKS
ncbi:DNA primase [Pontibacillus yanchengensis]|uniref:DNA primase n=2 Tax=Pontibacillus yanchengensis TaxID=462910 RepID=A0A6I4ZZG0_9BACI|nr:DNA primase [Pontibacillus yanchengensis]MYL33440.1 DNA primase [Pontibacillus yanchengensis]MYL53490.1 DNA primase [Pontibacillus yanchengensis]